MNFHKLFLVGRSTKDAETLTSKKGNVFAKVSLAVNDYNKDKDEEKTSYYDLLIFGKSAPNAVEKIKKGDLMFVEGRPESNAYISKDGEAKGTINVVCRSWNVIK